MNGGFFSRINNSGLIPDLFRRPTAVDVAACSATLQRRSLVSELAASVVKKGARGDFDKCERM
jgi:hypothetical protein